MSSGGSDFSRTLARIVKLSTGTLFTRIIGMFREITLAFFLGAGGAMDAFLVAFTLPNIFRRVVGEKVMESALVPVYKNAFGKSGTLPANRIAKTVLVWAVAMTSLIVAAGIVLAPMLVGLFAPGFSAETNALAVTMTRVMFPFLLLVTIFSFLGAMCISHDRFGVYGFAPALFSMTVIGVLGFGYRFFGPVTAAVGVLLGGIFQCAVMFYYLPETFSLKVNRLPASDPEVRQVWRLSAPIFLETFLEKAVTLVDRRLASTLVAGSISSLTYAFRLLQLPYGVLALAVSRVYYPILVDSVETPRKFAAILKEAIRFILVTMTPCAVGIFVFRMQFVRIIYRHGAFDEKDVQMTGLALAGYGAGILGMGFIGLMTRAFHSCRDTTTPVIVSVGLSILNIILNYILVTTSLKHAGLALASSIAYSAAGIVLFLLMRRRLRNSIQERISLEVLPTFIKVFLASMAGGYAGWTVTRFYPGTQGFISSLVTLAVGGTAGAIIYFAGLKLLRVRIGRHGIPV